jgi:hypothetical protein
MKDNKPDKEFTRFRAEADALLGIAAEKPPTKDAAPPPAAEGGAPANP